MRFKAQLIILVILQFHFASLFAQADISGLWKGYIYHDSTQKYHSYEVAINDNGKGKFSGYSHTRFIIDDEKYYGIKDINIKKAKDGKIVITDDELISNNYPVKPPKGVHAIYVLDLIETADSIILKGGFETNLTRNWRKATGSVYLSRKNDFKQSALIPHLQELGLYNKLTFLPKEEDTYIAKTNRKIETPTEITTSNKSDKTVAIATSPAITTPALRVLKETKKDEPVIVKTETVVPKSTSTNTNIVEKQKPVIQSKVEVAATKPTIQKTDVATAKPTIQLKKEEHTKPVATIAATPNVQSKQNEFAVATNAAKNIANRTIETVQSLYFVSDSLELTLYDNGEVDGDTVSVLLNGKVLMPNQGLSTKAIKKTIYTTDIKDSLQIIMYAENLGTIAPNTGLIILYDGAKRHEIRFSGDLQKSAAIILRRKQE